MKFKKKILPVGKYLVSTSSGRKVVRDFSADYLKTVAENSTKMIEAGLKVPAPFKHLKEAVPVTEELSDDAYANAGYWEKVWFEDDGLYGELQSTGDPNDNNTPAGKLTSTVKEVSACIKDSWTDGLGREWGPSMLHGAPVLHPVVPGQDGFELMEEAVALSISGMMSEPTPMDIAELSRSLEDNGVYLPPETLLEDLPKVLTIALKQLKLAKTQDPDDTEIAETRSVFMSHTGESKVSITAKEAAYLISLNAINPKTSKPFKEEDFDIQPDPREAINLSLTKTLISDKKSTLKKRVENLIETGRTSKEFAESKLYPQIDAYNLSFGTDATIEQAAIELLVENLESLDVPNTPEDKKGGDSNLSMVESIHDPSEGDPGTEFTPEQLDEVVKEMLSQV